MIMKDTNSSTNSQLIYLTATATRKAKHFTFNREGKYNQS